MCCKMTLDTIYESKKRNCLLLMGIQGGEYVEKDKQEDYLVSECYALNTENNY